MQQGGRNLVLVQRSGGAATTVMPHAAPVPGLATALSGPAPPVRLLDSEVPGIHEAQMRSAAASIDYGRTS